MHADRHMSRGAYTIFWTLTHISPILVSLHKETNYSGIFLTEDEDFTRLAFVILTYT